MGSLMLRRNHILVLIAILLLSAMFLCHSPIEPPGQDGSGPGDNAYTCDTETGLYIERNDMWTAYMGEELGGYIYAPSCSQRPEEAPVLFFFHAFIAEDQAHYEGFFRHLAGKNYIVIAPNYNTPGTSGSLSLAFNEAPIRNRDRGIAGAKAGYQYYMEHILDSTHVPAPMVDRGELLYGVAGHSFGGAICASFANARIRGSVLGDQEFKWNPKAVVMMNSAGVDLFPRCPGAFETAWCCPTCPLGHLMILFGLDNGYWHSDWKPDPNMCAYGEYVESEDGQHCMGTDGTFFWGDLSDIDYNPLWVVMGGEHDTDGGETAELQLYCKTTRISDKQYLRVRSDDHGEPFTNDLRSKHWDPAGADLLAPFWMGKVDGHDYWAYWKIVTAAMSCAIYGQDCNYARGGTEEQLSMGYWSDGQPVTPMQWNPRVRDAAGTCHDLGDHNTHRAACYRVKNGTWDWRGNKRRANCDE
jgi:hypothetical protein